MIPKINYFDLGLCSGEEISWMVNSIFPELGIENYDAYGFEAARHYADNLDRDFSENDRVHIIHKAISDHDEEIKLYHAPNTVGHSIFSTKNNVAFFRFIGKI